MPSPLKNPVAMVVFEAEVSVGKKQPAHHMTGWHVGTVALLAAGYSAYYFCRSDYSVALPLILAEQIKQGAEAHAAQIRLGSIASLGVLAYALGKLPAGTIADRFGGRRNLLVGMAGSILFTLIFMMGGGFPMGGRAPAAATAGKPTKVRSNLKHCSQGRNNALGNR